MKKSKRKSTHKEFPKKKIDWEKFDAAMRKIIKINYTP